MSEIEIVSESEEQTQWLGSLLGQLLPGPLPIMLQGTLGAGKSVLARGIARGLGVPDNVPITSPTFTLMNHYPARFDLYHFDLYRLSDSDELLEIGFDEFAFGAGVALIEWPERLEDESVFGLWLFLTPLDEQRRSIRLVAKGDEAENLLRLLRPELNGFSLEHHHL